MTAQVQIADRKPEGFERVNAPLGRALVGIADRMGKAEAITASVLAATQADGRPLPRDRAAIVANWIVEYGDLETARRAALSEGVQEAYRDLLAYSVALKGGA